MYEQRGKPKGKALAEPAREVLRKLIAERGESAVAREFGLAPRTLVRLVAGFGVYNGTAALVRERLAVLQVAAGGAS